MNLVERQVRQLSLLGVSRVRVWLSPQSEDRVRQLRTDLGRLYQVDLVFSTISEPGQIYEEIAAAGEPAVLLDGDVVYDERILAHLMDRGPGHAVVRHSGAAALWLKAAQAGSLGRMLAAAAQPDPVPVGHLLAQDPDHLGLHVCHPEELDPYVPSLRLTMAPYMVRLDSPGQIRPVDHLMYHRSFKGVIDAVARYGYYHLVRWVTRTLSRTTLPPNLFTLLSVLGIWGAIPCFALGYVGAGVVVAWAAVLLDSVDGKLARLTLHLSEAMGRFEHIAAMPGLGLWYAALGWHYSGGEIFSTHPGALATWVLLGSFLVDKMISGLFRKAFGKEIFDYRPVDAAFHLAACRRNTGLLILTLGVLAGREAEAFALLTGWMVFTLIFHAFRFAWVAATRRAAG